ncbi:MAG TPA: phosphomannomutase/phosphoglucomutase [Phycisphaerae bacterium]|nr:phosphomannomutase/phosphoglucomutase [Phycisphaerae bacterium]HOI54512.1 phosphomannomutase/phosphoglucomutase [Phycisphaerae bacterium]
MSENQRHCPGEKYTISDAVCQGRRVRHYPKCKGCQFNDDEVQPKPPKVGNGAPIVDAIFKAYDVRGKVPGQINEDVAWRIGHAAAQYLLSTDEARRLTGDNAKAIVVGHDMRSSGQALMKACSDGILATGADCVSLGEIETPAIYYAVGSLQAAGGIMITASHNPGDYNGFKITAAGVKPVGESSGLKDIQRIAQSIEQSGGPLKGKLRQFDLSSGYIQHVRRFARDIKPMKIVMDASNGMGSKWTPSILRDLAIDVVPLYFERSGRFVHEPNPLRDENVADLKQKVIETQARLGVSFDGDADRCVILDENGDRVGGDTLTALLAAEFLKAERGASIIYDLRSSWAVRETIESYGGVPRRERVGHSFMKATLRKYNAPFGGELSGHFYYRDNFYCDSGVITLMKVLSVVSQSDAPLSGILEPLRKYATTGEVNFHVEDKDEMIKQLARKFADGKVDFLDGVTVEYGDWWFNCRKSNTEPLLRLIVEARSQDVLDDKFAGLKAMLGEPANE